MCAGSKAHSGEGDQGGRAKGPQNNQQRQGQDPNCEMAKLGDQMEQANETGDAKKFDRLFQRIYELGKKLGPEYAALIDGIQDTDPESEVGQEISSTLDALDNLCGG
jgi:hypothetical protein